MDGKITRVRMDAEGSDLESCRRALDLGFHTISKALTDAVEASQANSGNAGPFAALVFPRDTEFVEEEFSSREGGLSYTGRRVISFGAPVEGFAVPAPESVMMTGRLLVADDDRLRRLERDSRVSGVRTERDGSGVWTLTAEMRDCDCGAAAMYPNVNVEELEHRFDCGGVIIERSAQGGSLEQALEQLERQLGYSENDWETGYFPPPGSVERIGDGCAVRLRFGDVETEVWVAPDVSIARAADIAADKLGLTKTVPGEEIRAADGSVVQSSLRVSALNLAQTFSAGPPR